MVLSSAPGTIVCYDLSLTKVSKSQVHAELGSSCSHDGMEMSSQLEEPLGSRLVHGKSAW